MPVAACPNPTPQPVHGVVVFDNAEFVALYPEFATVANVALVMNFGLASLIVDNSCCSVVSDANVRMGLLYLLTAHLTALAQGVAGQAPSGIVGRVADATEGSVSVSAEYASEVSQSMAYFVQTRYGALFWQLTLPYRTMTYIPPVSRGCDPYMYTPFGGGCF